MRGSWIDLPSHRFWLDSEADRLLAFASPAAHPVAGFAWLDIEGRPEMDRPIQAWITARMTHVFAVAHLRGRPGAGPFVDHGVAALRGPLRDSKYDGWFSALTPKGEPEETRKAAYEHAFVVLAAACATAADRPGAAGLLEDALSVVDRHFWRDDEGRSVESWDQAWTEPESYRGANSNMHLVEAFLAAADVTGEDRWRQRALTSRNTSSTALPARMAGDSPSISTWGGVRCSTTTPTPGTTPSGPTAPRSGTGWNGPACCCTWRHR